MKTNKKNRDRKDNNREAHREHPLPGQIPPAQKKQNAAAHHQAENDRVDDAQLVAHNKNDDLDEGERASVGEDSDLV